MNNDIVYVAECSMDAKEGSLMTISIHKTYEGAAKSLMKEQSLWHGAFSRSEPDKYEVWQVREVKLDE